MTAKKTTKRGRVAKGIIAGLREAVAHERGEATGVVVRRVTARSTTVSAAPAFTAAEIARLRKGHHLSQAVFAGVLNVSADSVRAWEQGKRSPDGAALRLLQTARTFPGWVPAMLHPASTHAPRTAGPKGAKRV